MGAPIAAAAALACSATVSGIGAWLGGAAGLGLPPPLCLLWSAAELEAWPPTAGCPLAMPRACARPAQRTVEQRGGTTALPGLGAKNEKWAVKNCT